MNDPAASALVRLKNRSKETGRSYQLCLRLFCQEEFIRRLEHSCYVDSLVLKGGMFLFALSEFAGRSTMDVDFLLKGRVRAFDEIVQMVQRIVDTPVTDFVKFEVSNPRSIALEREYPGVKLSLVGQIKNTRTPFEVDVGVGDVVVPATTQLAIPSQLSGFQAPTINAYSLETTVAEKLDAILHRQGLSSRMKDYFDIHYLAQTFDFDGDLLQAAFSQTFLTRGRVRLLDDVRLLETYVTDVRVQTRWAAFVKKIGWEPLSFDEVSKLIVDFSDPPYRALFQEREKNYRWDHLRGKWR